MAKKRSKKLASRRARSHIENTKKKKKKIDKLRSAIRRAGVDRDANGGDCDCENANARLQHSVSLLGFYENFWTNPKLDLDMQFELTE